MRAGGGSGLVKTSGDWALLVALVAALLGWAAQWVLLFQKGLVCMVGSFGWTCGF
jgi:hypothetical protein